MRILDRYILKSTLTVFAGCIFTFLWLYVIVDVFSHLDDILRHGIALKILAKYYAAFMPIIFIQVAPISCLLATLYTFGRLNRNNELIAMRSSGLSVLQISKSILTFGVLLCMLLFWVNDRLVPRSLYMTEKIKAYMEGGTKKAQEKEKESIVNLSIYGLKNRLFFVNRFSPSDNSLEGITILEHDKQQNITKKIIANRGEYKNGVWTFFQCVTYRFDENGQMQDEPKYMEEEIMTIPETPQDFLTQRQSPGYMNVSQLDFYIRKLSGSGASSVIRSLTIDLYSRFSACFAPLAIILLGIPFSLMMKKRATGLSSLGVAIMVGFLYYVVNAISLALGKAGAFPPLLAVSLSHLLALGVSVYLIKTQP
jgi:lipopolysaccharide export system permease protein